MEKVIMEFINENMLILVPILYVLGMMIKNTLIIKDKFIPFILLVFGIALAISVNIVQLDLNILESILTGVMQGFLTTGAAVYVNNLFKQSQKNN